MKNLKDKLAKSSVFVQELCREIDYVVSKLFKNVGILIISICILFLFLLWYISTLFEKESLFILFIIFMVILLVNTIIRKLPNNSRFQLVVRFITILGILLFIGFMVIGVGWEVFGFLKDTYNWIVE